ncbi:MAG: nucleoside hydrolase [Acidimicrobiia bacterium]|nr:nucleoside hydrolase [Acidimicrobiia bacterium]
MPTPIIIDTDPGQDDAVALLLALASPAELEVVAITTVAGNVPLELTTRNSLMMVELAGRTDVPVYAGCDQPMVRPLVTAEFVHGKSGIDGSNLPNPTTQPADGHAVDYLLQAIRQRPGMTLCTLGPLTNVGTALQREPGIAEDIEKIVLMGGGFFEGGNTTPAAEFNIYEDPQAADLVFRSGIPLVMMPLDVTHQALTSDARIQAFRDLGNAAGAATAGMLEFYERYDMERYGTLGGPLHDPTVIAYLLEPEMFGGRHCSVEIETTSELTMGMTVVDWWDLTEADPNCLVVNQIDDQGFYTLLTDRIGRLP